MLISMFNNAGFDLFGTVDAPFVSFTGYAGDFVVNFVAMMLIILGGIGFIVIVRSDGLSEQEEAFPSFQSCT